jgi:hypothetical protein
MSAKSLSGFATQHQSRIRAAACSVLLAVALGPTGAAAQALSDLTPDMRTRLEAAEQRLNLTPEQRSQVHAIVIEEVDKLKGIDARHEDDTSRATRRELFREGHAVQQDFRSRLAKVLSPEQLAEWDRIRKESIPELRKRLQAKKAEMPGVPTKP